MIYVDTLRNEPALLPRADVVLYYVNQLALNDVVVESASRFPEATLRSLDAIHLATALMIRDKVDVMITYDKWLAAAAQARKITTVAPC